MDCMIGMGMSSMMFFVGIFWLVLIGLLVYGIMKWLTNRKQNTSGKALQILNERYARGEITQEEYETMKRMIKE